MSSLLVALIGRLPSDSLYVASIFLAVQPFPYNSIWFAGIYVRGCIPKSFLVRVSMNLARNIVEDVRFIITTMVCSVLVVVWHYGCYPRTKEIRKG